MQSNDVANSPPSLPLFLGAAGEAGYVVQPVGTAAQAEFLVHPPPFLPDLVEGLLLTGGFVIPVTNLHPTRWLSNIKVVVSGRYS